MTVDFVAPIQTRFSSGGGPAMRTTGRLRRVLTVYLPIAGGGLLALACLLFFSAKFYLSSGAVAGKVSNRLEAVLGMPVQIGATDIGLSGGSSLGDVKGYEAEGLRPDKPWITVQTIQTDVSVLDLLGDAKPQQVTLGGVRIDLRFDKTGNLLTKLPHPAGTDGPSFPKVHIERGQLTLEQEGRPPMVVTGFTGDLRADGQGLALNGDINDPFWADWTLRASLGRDSGDIVINLKTPRTQVTQDKLERLPFILPVVWESVKADGTTPVDFTLRFNVHHAGVKYRVETVPENTRVFVPAINIDADGATGNLVVQDGLVELRDVKGRFVDGDILLPKADLDFRKPQWEMQFDVAVKNLRTQQLRERWPVLEPAVGAGVGTAGLKLVREAKAFIPNLKGQLTGQADLNVTLRGGKVHTSGTGGGVITTTLFDRPAQIRLRLHADKDGFHFTNGNAAPGESSLPLFRLPKLAPFTPAGEPRDASLLPPGAAPGGERVGFHPIESLARTQETTVPTPIGSAVNQLAKGLSDAGGGVGKGLGRFFGKVPPKEEATYLDINLALDDVDLAKVVKQFNLQLPFPVSGNVSFKATASLPVDAPNDLRAYRARGTATLTRFEIAGLEMTKVQLRFYYRAGLLSVEDMHGLIPAPDGTKAGSFEGEAQAQLVPLGDLTVRLNVVDIPPDRALAALPPGAGASGRISGQVRARTPLDRLTDPAAWMASGQFASDKAQVYGLSLEQVSARVEVANGTATIDRLHGLLGNAQLSGNGDLRLTGAFPYRMVLNLQDADLALLQKLKPAWRPPVQLAGGVTLETSLQGTLAPLTFKDTGKVQAKNVLVEGVTVDTLSFAWEASDDRVLLREIEGRLYQGRVTGSAVLPLQANVPATTALTLETVAIEKIAKRLLGSSVQLQGRVSGSYHAKWDGAGPNGVRENTTQLDLTAPVLRVEGFGVQQVEAHIDAQRGTTRYALAGKALGGKLDLAGTLPRAGEEQPADAKPSGRLVLEGGRLSQLGQALGMQEALDPLRGRLSLDIEFRHSGPDRLPVGRGRILVNNVRWHTVTLTDAFQAELRLNGEVVQIRELSGSVGGGELSGRVALNLKNPDRSYFNLSLDRAEASQVLAPVETILTGAVAESSGTTPLLQGALQVHLRGNLGREWRGNGTAVLTRGKVLGVEVSEWRWPINFTFNPRRGRGEIDIRDSTAQLAQGRATGEASLIIGAASRVEGSMRFTDVDLRTLVRSFGDAGSLAVGRVSGRLKFHGNEVRSLDDVNATLDATLTQTQALELPVLRLLVPYAGPGRGSTTFQQGDLQARLSNGVVRIQHLSLASDLLKVGIEGTLTRQGGRLNLDATVGTGNLFGLNNTTLLLLAREIPAAGPIPVALIAQLSTLLANRVVHLRIGGTLKTPSVQVEPIALLTEEAIRLLLGRVNVYVP